MEFLLDWGYLGLFLGSFLAATIVPFSSEFLFIGLLLAGGDPWLCLLAGTLGNWCGSLTCYGLGYLGKWEWIEKWLKIKPEKLEKQKVVIDKWGPWLALVCWLPFIGDVLAVGLGFYRVRFVSSAFFMLIGKGLRFLFWVGLWYLMPDAILPI